jgi:hypothetical protein
MEAREHTELSFDIFPLGLNISSTGCNLDESQNSNGSCRTDSKSDTMVQHTVSTLPSCTKTFMRPPLLIQILMVALHFVASLVSLIDAASWS